MKLPFQRGTISIGNTSEPTINFQGKFHGNQQPHGWENPKMVGKIVDTGNPDARKCSQKNENVFLESESHSANG